MDQGPSTIDLVRSQFEAHLETAQTALDELVPIISETAELIAGRLAAGGKVLVFGNGGSAAQADHLAAELLGRYRQIRKPLPAVSLSSSPGPLTCIANDFSFETVFERQVEALAADGDVVVGISTSGSSKNVLRGLKAGRQAGAATILLTGAGITDAPADYIVSVPSASTARVQEIHLVIIHVWCEAVEETKTADS